ncbi:HpcH/HpaI aldolase family protein [Natrinema salaciae]|uniref:4-hydroxy-2-oxoheptanedioate aldolase n=1 Tax=Natrinema salaciae TaxID=1186196 RepID=A0A1H9NTB8_9EURY|nr:aldolase/citrate lyase family protein [Natrinema salaciae]SER39162.1 4-hydroxy-2-oxoheptanedioate aldolase [Natrinema salaciae]
MTERSATDGDFEARFLAGDALGTWVSIGHPAVVEAAARAGFDFVLVDTEHTELSLETVADLARAAAAAPGELGVVVRPAWNDPVRIKRILDIGVDGIMVPMIDTPEAAEELVRATRYPPDGDRGVASGRAAGYGQRFVQYVESGHRSLLTIAQIETPAGVDHAEDIAVVDGIDALFVGPADLSASLGVFAEWDAPKLDGAMARVVEAGANADAPVGTLTVREGDVADRVERGFDFQIAGKDMTTLIETGERIRETYEKSRSERE